MQQYFAGLGMKWSFNLEKAPWWGGVFERLIKSVKRCLRKTIGQANLSYDELLTTLAEVEMIVNSRPLSYVSTEDVEEPFTPSHLLVGRRALSLPDTTFQHEIDEDEYNFELTSGTLSRRMDYLKKTLNHFWKRWQREYLLELRDSHRHYNKAEWKGNTLSEGQVVVVHSDRHPREFWKLARIQKLIQGSDGHVRGATIRLPSKSDRTKLLRRPLQCLYPLEVDHNNRVCDKVLEEAKDSTTDHNVPSADKEVSVDVRDDPPDEVQRVRPTKRAAQKANEFIRAVMTTDSDEL